MNLGGCGRFFEGTGNDMDVALNQKISQLPGNTRIYCGHEYTVSNLKFGLSVEPTNEAVKVHNIVSCNLNHQKKLEWATLQRENGLSTLPSTLDEEKEHNVFLRLHSTEIRRRLGLYDTTPSYRVMSALRERKDNWRGE